MRENVGRHGRSHSGIAWTDRDGHAVVNLPAFARLHEAGFDYELETVGSEIRVTLAHEVIDGHFAIVSEKPHVKVAWQVTAYNQSPICRKRTNLRVLVW